MCLNSEDISAYGSWSWKMNSKLCSFISGLMFMLEKWRHITWSSALSIHCYLAYLISGYHQSIRISLSIAKTLFHFRRWQYNHNMTWALMLRAKGHGPWLFRTYTLPDNTMDLKIYGFALGWKVNDVFSVLYSSYVAAEFPRAIQVKGTVNMLK